MITRVQRRQKLPVSKVCQIRTDSCAVSLQLRVSSGPGSAVWDGRWTIWSRRSSSSNVWVVGCFCYADALHLREADSVHGDQNNGVECLQLEWDVLMNSSALQVILVLRILFFSI